MATLGARWAHAGLALAALGLGFPGGARAQGPSPAPPAAPAPPPVASVVEVPSPAQPKPLFLRPEQDYGSAGMFSPLGVLLNRGFSTLIWRGAETRPLHIDWRGGWGVVWRSVAHPGASIERRGGFGPWLRGEILPVSWDPLSWMFASNYAGHVVAGGITYRMLAEWYEARGVPGARIVAGATTMGAILINEAIENQHGTLPSPGSTADLLVFEPLGIGLFSIDGVARVFARSLNAADWSPQASVTLPDLELENVSQVVAYHFPLPGVRRTSFLILTGQGTQMGGLLALDGGYSLGAAGGFVANARLVDDADRERITARVSGGLYLARENSLVGSLNVFTGSDARAELNVYPGLLGRVGAWAIVHRTGRTSLGLTARPLRGIGLGYNTAGDARY